MHAQEVAQAVLAPQEHASRRKWKCYVLAVYPQEHSKRKKLKQGLKGYSRDPGFDQNTVRDSGKRKTSWRDSGFDCYEGSGIHQIWVRDAGGILLPVCQEFGKSSRPKKPLQRQKRINQASAKYQSKGLIYILNLLAFAEISLF